MRTLVHTLLLIALGLGPVTPAVAQSPAGEVPIAPSAAARQEIRDRLAELVKQLDDDRFSVRHQAGKHLEELAAREELKRPLAEEIQRVLLRSDLSFEVRTRLDQLSTRLPEALPAPPDSVAAEELDRLVKQLDDDSYGLRLGATRRLQWLLGNPKLSYPVMVRVKQALSEPDRSEVDRRKLEPILKRARATWLLSDPTEWDLPPVTVEQMRKWVDDLAQPLSDDPADARALVQHRAERELLDVMTRDKYVPIVKQLLTMRLQRNVTDDAAARLRALLDLTRPALVAEYWQGGQNLNQQHLLVGVPSQSPIAARPSHFDYIDDERAHCVSGNNLSEGDYPVGVAFPHPNQEGAAFCLINLPTPRRRMAYPLYAETDEVARLATLTRRTAARWLKRKEPLSEAELVMLGQLDSREISRFAGEFFNLVDDQPLPPTGSIRAGGRPSRHGLLAAQLAIDGTKEAADGLIKAIESGCFLPPTSLAQYRLEWLAALSIAARDPWPGADDWLAEVVSQAEPLVDSRPDGPDLGATAAAILLRRHDRLLSQFQLRPAGDPEMLKLNTSGYRFAAEEARQKVQQWWQREKASQKKRT